MDVQLGKRGAPEWPLAHPRPASHQPIRGPHPKSHARIRCRSGGRDSAKVRSKPEGALAALHPAQGDLSALLDNVAQLACQVQLPAARLGGGEGGAFYKLHLPAHLSPHQAGHDAGHIGPVRVIALRQGRRRGGGGALASENVIKILRKAIASSLPKPRSNAGVSAATPLSAPFRQLRPRVFRRPERLFHHLHGGADRAVPFGRIWGSPSHLDGCGAAEGAKGALQSADTRLAGVSGDDGGDNIFVHLLLLVEDTADTGNRLVGDSADAMSTD